MNIIETFKIAISSIWANKMRSFLTMLGIIIGIASVITIMALGQGSKQKIGDEFENFGVNRIYIGLNWRNEKVDYWRDGLTNSDLQLIQKVFKDDLAAISPSDSARGEVAHKKGKEKVDISAVGESYDNIEKIDIFKGRFLSKEDIASRRPVAIIDQELAKAVYKTVDVLGKKVKVDTGERILSFTVVGIYKKPESAFDKIGQSFGDVPSTKLYCPISILSDPSVAKYYGFEATVADKEKVEEVQNKIIKYMHKKKRMDTSAGDFYRGYSAQQEMNQLGSVLGIVSGVVGAIAAISLLVGGIGIMNIMLVSVTERTREIGIRKAIGATKNSILFQFIVESMIISGLGGMIGTLLGMLIAKIAGSFIGFEGVVSLSTVMVAVSFSCGVGMFFGIYPANKAAKMDPIDALRYE